MSKMRCDKCGDYKWPGHDLCWPCEMAARITILEAENAALKAQLEAVKAWFRPLDINWDAIGDDE